MEAKFEVPIGGLNARDNYDNMPPTDAIVMNNFVPEGGYLRSRGGSQIHINDSELLSGDNPKKTLANFDGGGTQKLLSAFDDGTNGPCLYDVTSTPVLLSDGHTTSVWNHMLANGRMVLTNGQDDPQVWDGGASTSDATIALFDGTGSPHPTLTKSDLWGCVMHQNRAYYWAENSQSFFYTDVAGAYQGDITEFDLSFVSKQGGYLVNILSQSMDTGNGLYDVAVFVFSTGECLVYEGSDPAAPQDWGLVNRFSIGVPVNIRCTAKWGADNIILTSSGIISIDEILKYGSVVINQPTLWNKITEKVRRYYRRHKNNEGWDIHYSPSTGFIIINYLITNGASRQIVLNTKTGAWCEFRKLEAYHWADHNGGLYFGGSSRQPHIWQAETGVNDNEVPIEVKCITAFQDYGLPGWKQLTRVALSTNFRKKLRVDAQVDNGRSADTGISTPIEYFPTQWNTSQYGTFQWGSIDPNYSIDTEPNIKHYPCHGRGYTMALKIRGISKAQEIIWYFYKLRLKKGGDR